MAHKLVVLPGDGVGQEVLEQALRVVEHAAPAAFDVDSIPCGGKYFLEHGRDWPVGAEERCRAADLILLGAVGWPSPEGRGPVTMPDGRMAGYSAVIGNRLKLDLYANVRPVKLFDGVQHRISGAMQQVWRPDRVDMVFLRENTEGLYAGMGGTLSTAEVPTIATDTRVITRRASERIIRRAFEMAQHRDGAPKDGKKRVTAIVKNNVLEGCRLFNDVFFEIGESFPDIEKDVAIVDAFTQWLVTEPERYDVCVTTNMFGDIVTDLASVLQGGMGMAVGCNIGDEHGMFEPIHGSAPPLAGTGRANPIAMILAAAEGLRWLGARKDEPTLVKHGARIEAAVKSVVHEGMALTEDLVGAERAVTMDKTTDAILAAM